MDPCAVCGEHGEWARDCEKCALKSDVYRKFVPNIITIAEPLYQLTRKNQQFQWNDSCQSAFETMKEKLTETPILGLL